MSSVAAAQPPGATPPKTLPAGDPSLDGASVPRTYTFGVDAHAAFGVLIGTQVGARFELGLSPGHALVLRAGIGKMTRLEEGGDMFFRELLARFGYRISSRRLFAGIELGESGLIARYPEDRSDRNPKWSANTSLTLLAGVRLGRVRVSLDFTAYTAPFQQIGVQLGIDLVRL